MSNLLRPLAEVSHEDIAEVGGKAASLGKMTQSGLPIPPGYAVTLAAFDEQGGLSREVRDELASVLDANKRYAVRSSALAEDAEGASWAGQFESFLDTAPGDVPQKVEECHGSAKARATAYASDKETSETFDIAVVVQEMVTPEYAGVLFTKDPMTGEDHLITEYVEGLGEELVSGRAEPKRITWNVGEKPDAPFDVMQLTRLAQKAEEVFGLPQDIEWVWANDKMWLVQARPITATQNAGKDYYLGEPEDLFYWGPSRAKPLYMSDFMAAVEEFFIAMANDPAMPNPPQSLVLFHDGKMVWLSNAEAFADFTEKTFEAYEKRDKFAEDYGEWLEDSALMEHVDADLVDGARLDAWGATLFAEFSLYGAESIIAKRLARFEAADRQEILGTFAVPDGRTFFARIDEELLQSKDPAKLAEKYPWIKDGYEGAGGDALQYFTERLRNLDEGGIIHKIEKKDREALAKKFSLSDAEVHSLTLARKLAEYMDERKVWMMSTRRTLITPLSPVKHGWFFSSGSVNYVDESETAVLWERYINFRASTHTVKGVVASNGDKRFVNGEVVVIDSPTDITPDDRIVVVPSTSPSYVPLMRKARALITDHGGMMSHAAIVAREFGLPCIVGTKQATKVLKNGDKVMLDLVSGEVSK